jgi:hypothetical protein
MIRCAWAARLAGTCELHVNASTAQLCKCGGGIANLALHFDQHDIQGGSRSQNDLPVIYPSLFLNHKALGENNQLAARV